MSEQNPSVLSHVSIGTNNFEAAAEFYEQVLPTIGLEKIMDEPEFKAVAWGRAFPEFWIQAPIDHQPATVGNGSHVAFLASSTSEVHAFYDAAMAAGAKDDGAPGPRPHYSEAYYACFIRDLDGHKIEAMYWDESKDPKMS